MKIVIAEDEYISLMGMKANLEELGHEVVGEAIDGRDAVDKVLSLRPDMVIIDINMPIMDGIEVLTEIRKFVEIPGIIVSGYHDEKLIKRANDAGVYGYLVKPVSMHDVKVAIETSYSRFSDYQQVFRELKKAEIKIEERKYIEKAKGILMEKKKLSERDAMKSLQKMSRDKNIKMVVLAKKIIEAADIMG